MGIFVDFGRRIYNFVIRHDQFPHSLVRCHLENDLFVGFDLENNYKSIRSDF